MESRELHIIKRQTKTQAYGLTQSYKRKCCRLKIDKVGGLGHLMNNTTSRHKVRKAMMMDMLIRANEFI